MLENFFKNNNILKKNIFFNFIESKEFISLFEYNHRNLYNKDEIRNICNMLENEWSTLEYSKEKNIFNIVAKFACNVLKENENEPVCQHDKLFKWRDVTLQLGEDIFTTAFLAYNDLLKGKKRSFFTWKSIICTDNVRLQEILKKGISENHFHLKGSSPHFQLAWISLMNKIKGRREEFKKLEKNNNLFLNKSINYAEMNESLEILIKKAALIRIFLFEKFILNNEMKEKTFKEFYNKYFINEEIENRIKIIQYLHGKNINNVVPDYAIPKNITIDNYRIVREYNGMILLYGERAFLYNLFRLVFSGNKKFKPYIDLLYIYLCIKQKLRNEIIQVNKNRGFGNFLDYQNRKEIFIPQNSIYEKAIVNIAINSSLIEQNIEFLETRIAPKRTMLELKETLIKIEERSKDTAFFKNESLVDRILRLKDRNYLSNENKYFYTIHFIKNYDAKKEIDDIYPRNHDLRKKIEKEALVINEFRKSSNHHAEKIYGIDAANIEIGCRSEVFAHVFRYLKNYRYYNPNIKLGINNFHEIGQTFHVGEDFLDLLDGIRAIDEVLRFLNFGQGDRLGHALAMGIDPINYYEIKENIIILPKQIFLDNIVWALCKKDEVKIEVSSSLCAELENLFRKYYIEIYFDNVIDKDLKFITYRDYYEAWKLRGDSPYPYLEIDKNGKLKMLSLSFLEKSRFNESIEAVEARKNIIAKKLYKEYHFNEKVKRKGNEMMEYKIYNKEYITLVERLQQKMQEEIARKNIYIETNPTSNILIGSIDKYIKHPILKFNDYGLVKNSNSFQISVSINTDDQGIFATRLENEYALIVLALLKEKDENGNYIYNQEDIYEWIDRVRQRGLEHSFKRMYANKIES